jgi:predicted metal-dependent hydrolase
MNDRRSVIPIDRLVRSRRKTIALIIDRQGRLIVRAPLRATRAQIDAFITEKAGWIQAHQASQRARPHPAAPEFRAGETFLYLGQACPLQLTPGAAALELRGGVFHLAPAALPQARQLFQAWYRRQARAVLAGRVALHAARLGFTPGALRITSARTRWGSCSSRGTLSFPWRLVLAPLEVIDYVVVHELVHLAVKNHSAAFWQRVTAAYPDTAAARRWLKEHSGLGEELANE